MTFKEVEEFIKEGDKIINTFMIRSNKYEIWRNDQKVLTITYNQLKKLTKDLHCKVICGGFTKHIYSYTKNVSK